MLNANNFWQQSKQADEWYAQQTLMNYKYRSEFPDKMEIFGDEVTIKDLHHYSSWKKENGYK